MPFAGDEDGVIGVGEFEGAGDGGPPVDESFEMGGDFCADGGWIL